MAALRVSQAMLAAAAYYGLGLFTAESLRLCFWIIPGVLVGVPLGSLLMKRVRAEAFRRFCMSYDAWIVGYGLSRVLIVLELLASPTAYVVWLGVGCVDAWLLYTYFTSRRIGAATISRR